MVRTRGMSTELVREVAGVSLSTQRQYVIKRKFWSFLERVFRVWTADGQLIMYIKHPIMKLREEFMVYEDEAQTRPLLRVKSKQVIALNLTYEITDATSGVLLGSVRKQGLKSLLRDKFIVVDANEQEVGYAGEQGASVLRRFFPWLTSKHAIFANNQPVASISQVFRFFTKEFNVEIHQSSMDPRFVLAIALLALMAEARRENG